MSQVAETSCVYIQQGIAEMVNDFGMVALALLAHDRCQAVSNPMIYLAEIANNKKRLWLRIGLACLLVLVVHCPDLSATVWYDLTWDWDAWRFERFCIAIQFVTLVSNAMRSTYLFACLFM